jgi:hypothetical protein
MTTASIRTTARIAVLAIAASGAVALSACEEHAYPSAAPREGTAAVPAGDESLAGAPSYAGPPTTRTPEYVPPPQGASPDAPPPPPGYAPPGYAANGYPPPANTYPPGYGHQNASGAPPTIVSMAPIPNPPEHPRGYGLRHQHRRVWMRAYPAPVYAPAPMMPPHHHHRHPHHVMVAPASRPMQPRHHAAPVVPHVGPAAPAPAHAATQLTKPVAPDHHKHHHHAAGAAQVAPATAAAASGGPTNTTASGSEADRYQALDKSLKDDFGSAAQLQTPDHMEANQSYDVTLTLPSDFAQTVQSEAGKQGLASELASLNLTATLGGDGYTVTPVDPQTLPLAQNQPTVFRWKVTPTGAGRGALTASVKAAAPGGNHTLDLGSKATGSPAGAGRVVGIGLLALVALGLLGWAAQRRRPSGPSGASKPRANHTNGAA